MKEPFVVKEVDLLEIAKKVTDTLASSYSKKAKVLFLEGDLGAGKTTFTKALASALGIKEEDVHSPTFILKKEYVSDHPTFKKLIHVDAYRFDSRGEAKALKLERDLEDGSTMIVIEWPSKMEGIIKEDMAIDFSVIDDDTREMVINYANSESSSTRITPDERSSLRQGINNAFLV